MPLWTPTKQWAQVLKQTGEGVTYERIPVPKPATDEVLVHIQFTGFCHTDMNAFNGDLPISTKLPLVAGHEGLGIVVACGAKVKDPKEGARVGIMWINRTCLTCAFCLGGEERLCEQAKFTGYTVDGTFQRATSIVKSLSGDRAGAYDAAEYAVVQAAHAVDIPGDVPFEKIAPLLCAGLTAYRAIKDCGARKGNIIAVVGAGGGVGSMALQFAKLKGFRTIAIDTGEQKKKLCQKYGASVFIDFATCEDVIHAVRSETDDGLGAHAVILAADRQEPIQQATEVMISFK
ncbi:MAG: alcohol dehydrogenase [Piccolia ochrophora]|nr:MAG: alcohol dehydrogenase [Piccolia ochrophora]